VTRASNDNTDLTPRTTFDGPELRFDFPGLEIGVAEYDEGPTGCTVFHFPAGVPAAMDVRGGSPAYVGDYGFVHAVCFAGGSIYGLEAASGVAAELFARRGHSTAWNEIAVVSGAIIYDYRPRQNAIYPDKTLGRAALQAARPGVFPLGPRGAGRSATVGKGPALGRWEPAGQGGAIRQLGATKTAVFTVVNAIGAIVDRDGRVVRGHLDPDSGTRRHAADALARAPAANDAPPGNTTLTLVATNQQLDRRALVQLGRQVHASMARAIQPFHALNDGDVLVTVSTGEVIADADALDDWTLGVLAAETAWDAVLTSFSPAAE